MVAVYPTMAFNSSLEKNHIVFNLSYYTFKGIERGFDTLSKETSSTSTYKLLLHSLQYF